MPERQDMAPTQLTPARSIGDDDLIDHLRRAASVWFKNSDLLLLEELIRRFQMEKPK